MKKISVVAMALLAIFIIPLLLPYAAPSSDYSTSILSEDGDGSEISDIGTVSGRLTSRGYGAEGSVIFTATTTASYGTQNEYETKVTRTDDGWYTIQLPPGEYSAKARSTGIEEVTYSTTIVVVAGETIEGINFAFVEYYTLTGTVRYGDMGLGNATVSLYKGSGARTVVETNPEGYYQFTNLQGGTYTILFEKEGFKNATYDIDMEITPYFNTQMYRAGLPGINGFILEYDFQHSMMIIGLIGMVVMIVLSLTLRLYASKNPSLIFEDDLEEDKNESPETPKS